MKRIKKCPHCGSTNYEVYRTFTPEYEYVEECICLECRGEFLICTDIFLDVEVFPVYHRNT